jgi:hypothetical protein
MSSGGFVVGGLLKRFASGFCLRIAAERNKRRTERERNVTAMHFCIAAMQTNMAPALFPPQLGPTMGTVERAYRTTEDRTQMTMQQERAAALVVQAIIETIEESKDGAPLGVMYAALMGMISYDTFMTAINALARAGVIRVSNNCAYPVKQRLQ